MTWVNWSQHIQRIGSSSSCSYFQISFTFLFYEELFITKKITKLGGYFQRIHLYKSVICFFLVLFSINQIQECISLGRPSSLPLPKGTITTWHCCSVSFKMEINGFGCSLQICAMNASFGVLLGVPIHCECIQDSQNWLRIMWHGGSPFSMLHWHLGILKVRQFTYR